jgi:gliding motility-associated-like protein
MKRNNYVFQFVILLVLLFGNINGFSQVTVASSNDISCSVTTSTLTATKVGDAPSDAGITVDDYYPGTTLPIGFAFQYYGASYTNCLIGPNGTVCFNTALTGAWTDWTIYGTLASGLDPVMKNSVGGPWCDVDITGGGTIKYSTTGVAPNRKFIVTFCATHMYSCTSEWLTTQMIFYETSNNIEVHLGHRTLCSSGWNGSQAIIGIMNAAGTASTTAPGRNCTPTWTAVNEGWRFTPDVTGASYTVASIPYAPVPYAINPIIWYTSSGAYLGTGTTTTVSATVMTSTLTVSPTTTTTYKVGSVGCADTSWAYVTVNVSPLLVVTGTPTNPSQCGLCDGGIVLLGMTPGSIDTINYTKDGVPQPTIIATVSPAGTVALSGLCAGAYTNITVKQGACTSAAISETLTDPAISISTVPYTNPTLCGVCDGSLTLMGLYPVHTFTINYTKDGAPQPPIVATTTGSGSIVINGLCQGVYDNIVASYGSCSTPPVGPYTLSDPAISISGVTPTGVSYCGVCNGKLVLHGLYPSHAFTVSYTFNSTPQPSVVTVSDASGNITLPNLCAGDYNNIVASFGSCTTAPVGPYTVTFPPTNPGRIIDTLSPSQCGFSDGKIYIKGLPPFTTDTVRYSKGGFPQPDAITSALSDSTVILTGLTAGNYSAFSVKIGDCIYNIVGNATLIKRPLTAGFTDEIHLGCLADTVKFTNTSLNVGPLYYVWSFGDGLTDTSKNPVHLYHQGSYTVTLIATNYACVDSAKASFNLDHPLSAAFTASPTLLCQGGTVAFTNSSVGGVSYQWNFGNGAMSGTSDATYTYSNQGQYNAQLIVTDALNCKDTAYTPITVDTTSGAMATISDSTFCTGNYATFTGHYASIGNTGVTWTVLGITTIDSIRDKNPLVYAFPSMGSYTVMVTPHYRICKDPTTSRVVTILPTPVISMLSDTSICAGSEVITLHDNLNDGTAGASWVWSTGSHTSSAVIAAPGKYYVTVNIHNCTSTDTINVTSDCYMNIPNAFTPNNDGVNDYFFPRNLLTRGLTSFGMQIYNRWGQLIFETNSLTGAGWDGKMNGANQPEGVFVYVIDATFRDGQKEHHQGNVTLLR